MRQDSFVPPCIHHATLSACCTACHRLCSALRLVLGIISASVFILTGSHGAFGPYDNTGTFLSASHLNWVSFPNFSQQKPNSIREPAKNRAEQWRNATLSQVSPDERHKGLLLELRGLEGSGKAQRHLLKQRLCQNLYPLLQETSEGASGKWPIAPSRAPLEGGLRKQHTKQWWSQRIQLWSMLLQHPERK